MSSHILSLMPSKFAKSCDDTLSQLPEEMVSHILSLMPTKFAVRTSILSKRWRYKWMFVTNLDFDVTHGDPFHYNSFEKFVDQLLDFCKLSQVKLFRLHFPHTSVPNSCISRWIDKAVMLNIRELDIQVMFLEVPLSMFTCKTLTSLKLNCGIYDLRIWVWPSSVYLPSLKTLDVVVNKDPFVNAFKLIHCCPMLQNLSLEVRSCNTEEVFLLNIPTLKRLKLTWLKGMYDIINKVVLNLPNLEYLFVGGILCSYFVMEDVSSLVEASVSFHNIRSYPLWFELLKGIQGIKSLSAQNVIDLKIPFISPLPMFPLMKQLKLKGFWHYGLIPQFLESCTELKHLYIENVIALYSKDEESSWIATKLLPACMLKNLTTIKFSRCTGHKCDIEMLEYMLGNAEVLKRVTIIWENLCEKDEKRLAAQVLNFPRASRYCEIHLRGN